MSDLDNLLGDEPEQVEETPQPEPEAVAQEVEAKPAESEAEPEQVDQEPVDEQPKSVPHERFHAVNQRAKELETELEKLKQSQAKPAAAPDLSHLFAEDQADPLPDPIDNPQAYNQAIETRFNQRLSRERFNTSKTFAEQVHGVDVVNEALAAFGEASQANGLLKQAANNSPNPVGEIVNWHRNQQFLAEVQNAGGPEAYKKALQEAAAQAQPAQTQLTERTAAPVMPTDMATARSAAPRAGGFQPAQLKSLLD